MTGIFLVLVPLLYWGGLFALIIQDFRQMPAWLAVLVYFHALLLAIVSMSSNGLVAFGFIAFPFVLVGGIPRGIETFLDLGMGGLLGMFSAGAIASCIVLALLSATSRMLGALVLVMLSIWLPLQVQSWVSSYRVTASAHEFRADCLIAQPFRTSVQDYLQGNSGGYHAIIRKGDTLYSWSYRSQSWQEIPAERAHNIGWYSPNTDLCPGPDFSPAD